MNLDSSFIILVVQYSKAILHCIMSFIKVFALKTVLSIFYLDIRNINGLSTGASSISCRSLYPIHGVRQQNSNPPYEIHVSANSVYGNNETVTVTIRGQRRREWFRGFMLQAKPTGFWQKRSEKSIGYFRRTEGMKLLDCYGAQGNAITQSHAQYNDDVVVVWVPPNGYVGRVTFLATVVRTFHEFWLHVHSRPVTIR